KDPDRSARVLARELGCGVIITDTFGRVWRDGLLDAAIGIGRVPAFLDFRGQTDPYGHRLRVTLLAAADALSAAAGLAMGKTAGSAVLGMSNSDAARWCDAAIVSVPYDGHDSLFQNLKDALRGKIIIDATVPIDPENIFQIKTVSGKSAAEETAAIVSGANVFAAFQTISHRVLRQTEVSHDVLVAGGSTGKAEVLDLIRSMGLRA